MKNVWIKGLLYLLAILILWVVLLFCFDVIASADQAQSDNFSGPAFITSLILVTLIILIRSYIRLANQIRTLRASCEGKRQQVENEKSELENLIKRMKAVSQFYYNETAKQSHAKYILESLNSVNLLDPGSQALIQSLIRSIASDITTRPNAELQQMLTLMATKEENFSKTKKDYNNTVSYYNAFISQFPVSLLQTPLNLVPLEYFYERDAII